MEELRKSDIPFEAFSGHEPSKHVKVPQDIAKWQRSEAYYDLMGFINAVSCAIQGKRINDPSIYVSPIMKNLVAIFDKLNKLVDESPPVDQPTRFGNKGFRVWASKMHRDIFLYLKEALPQEKCDLFTELGSYLSESFGNSVRIDYGTGHELSFIFFLCALFKAELLTEEDSVACVLRLFNTYLIFVRRLQKEYHLEPAGSQGVWSLDDFQFVPFIWGSAQLAFNSPFEPVRFLDDDIINEYKDEYLFIGCIDYINQVKTGHFAEHSNQLWSISAVPTWSKINSGLIKMYQKEILSKYPIMQHALFGKLLRFEPVKPGTTLPVARLGFIHPASTKSSMNSISSSKLASPTLQCSEKDDESVSKSTTVSETTIKTKDIDLTEKLG
ncbi:PREDICTED: serine/threonine-protein phosphatase 2A activator [Rhagoletis zephyria]|uniref:serine/threonine-protein phosphatase 2A activator n=1 Tax=Rhagoletis zephyria TaxID=28612 RepID=UPI000811443A|nr:PREDICTED: serine/threonine-protein phosphatase 2A activator [Rhagoletis zephyria]